MKKLKYKSQSAKAIHRALAELSYVKMDEFDSCCLAQLGSAMRNLIEIKLFVEK